MLKKVFLWLLGTGFVIGLIGLIVVGIYTLRLTSNLPEIITPENYEPKKVTTVYDRNNVLIGEFFREKRELVTSEQIPKHVKDAFVSSEDAQFYKHTGVNPTAIFRALIANIKAGKTVQGGSTITQQVAKNLLLTNEKTLDRKIKEAALARKIEKKLKKEEILLLYLNQIYLGQGAYGMGSAAKIYFRKPISELTVEEAALMAGLPQAPSRYSPLNNPKAAKNRQLYVLKRMYKEGYITKDQHKEAKEKPLTIYPSKSYKETAPYYLETVRQLASKEFGSDEVLEGGLKIYTALDLEMQKAAQVAVQDRLKELDKRQGFRGPLKNIANKDKKLYEEQLLEVLTTERKKLWTDFNDEKILQADGTLLEMPEFVSSSDPKWKGFPQYFEVDQTALGVITKISNTKGFALVKIAETEGVILLEDTKWARKPDKDVFYKAGGIKKLTEALKVGDVAQFKLVKKSISDKQRLKLGTANIPNTHLALFELDQDPIAQAAILSFDLKTSEIVTMVGGNDFSKSEYNRAYQALRQTGSAFKPLVYGAALEKEYLPSTPILDIPITFTEAIPLSEGEEGQKKVKKYRPQNHSNTYSGTILFRNALVKSLNIPTIRIAEDITTDWIAHYARRFGIFNKLNPDVTLSLGSSNLTLYEMTKAYSVYAKNGRKIYPLIIKKVESHEGEVLDENISLDWKFKDQLRKTSSNWEEKQKNLYSKYDSSFKPNSNQLISAQNAFVMTDILRAVVNGGTGAAARALKRPAAGKTGTTNGYFDAWFMGYTPQFATGVWVGHDEEKSLGRGEVGGRAALPIWLDFMQAAHKGLPVQNFSPPSDITYVTLDYKTGKLASPMTERPVRQAFATGTQPTEMSEAPDTVDAQDFLRDEL